MTQQPEVPLEDLDDEALEEIAARAIALQQVRQRRAQAEKVIEQIEAEAIESQEQLSMRFHRAQIELGLRTSAWVAPTPGEPWTRYPEGMAVTHNDRWWSSTVPQNEVEPGTDPNSWQEAYETPEPEITEAPVEESGNNDSEEDPA